MQPTTLLGFNGEQAVAAWLKKQGYVILTCNYRTRCGEVDVIAQRAETVCFVEVKTRKTKYFPISLAITTTKQKRIARAAKWYIAINNLNNHVLRFDIALVTWSAQEPAIEYIPNAFVPQIW